MTMKPIPGHDHYFATEDGVIMSDRSGILKPVKAWDKGGGYLRVQLGRGVTRYVHRLVCLTFHGEAPSPAHQVAHGNGDPGDNRAANLRWATHVENQHDRWKHGTSNRGERHGMDKLTEDQVREIRRLYASGMLQREIAPLFGVTRRNIGNITSGRSWKWLK